MEMMDYKSRFVNLSYLPSETGLDLSPKSAAHCWLLPEAPEEGGLLTFQHWFVDSQGLLLSQASSHHPGQPDLLGQSALTGLHEEEDPAVPVPGSSTSMSKTFPGVSEILCHKEPARSKQNIPQWGYFVFQCDKLVLYGRIVLAPATLYTKLSTNESRADLVLDQ